MNYISKTRTGRAAKRLLIFGIFIIAWGLVSGSEPLFLAGNMVTIPCLLYILVKYAILAKGKTEE